jgi:hypothetical protein
MAELTNSDFMSPYEVGKYLSGVIAGRQFAKHTFLQDFFGDRDVFETDTFNVDREFDQKNVMGQYVHPKADGGYIQLPDFGSEELRAAYAKEAISSDDFVTLNQRQIGDQFGQVDVQINDTRNLQKKLSNALAAFDNLKEKAAADILFLGAHTASGHKASTVVWDFNRTTITTDADYLAGYVPEINLTTLVGNGGAGKRAWDSTGGTKAPTPYIDIKKMVSTAKSRGKPLNAIVMDGNAYQLLEDDINANYAKAADMTLAVMQRVELKILPIIENYQDATFQRTLSFGAEQIDIYTYTGAANNRVTGAKEYFVPTGYIVGIPDKRYQLIRYGRIMNRKARWEAMPIWINSWVDYKTGELEQELHTSFLLAPWDPDSIVSWKVASA